MIFPFQVKIITNLNYERGLNLSENIDSKGKGVNCTTPKKFKNTIIFGQQINH